MNVVSFGGGTNSTAMIIGMYLHKIPIDLILFADTGGEQPHTYEFMGTFNEWLVKHGIPKIVSVEYHDKDGNRLPVLRASAAGDRARALLQQCELPKPICKRMRRGFVGCEINPSYVEMAAGRISEVE